LAQILNIKQSNVCRLEKGSGNPTISALQKIADKLGYQLHIAFTEKHKESKQ